MLLYSPKSVYQLDKAAVEQDGIAEIDLMQRAGQAVWRAVTQRWPDIAGITVFAGAGNNGGDAFVVALCAQKQGVAVQFIVQGDLLRQSDTSSHYSRCWSEAGGEIEAWQGQAIEGELIIDGLLGIGLQRGLDQDWQALIEVINRQPVPRVAIDIPSGLNGLTGVAQPVAVEAQLTVTFIGAKTGQLLASGPDYCGELLFDDLGSSADSRRAVEPRLETIDRCRLPAPRRKNSHKNHYGNLLIVGGDQGMSGAVALASLAALRCGAGLVTALVHPECRGNLAVFPEIMVLDWDHLESKIEQADVIVVGPGLGESQAADRCLRQLQSLKLPMVVDASALNPDFVASLVSEQVVITPHPGEAATLLQTTTAQVQADRLSAMEQLLDRYGATTVLKGADSLIDSPGQTTSINTHGHPGMATAGMGDVLSGIIAAMLGQGLGTYDAARTGVFLHALCAEQFSQQGDQISLIASDVIAAIPSVLRRLRDSS